MYSIIITLFLSLAAIESQSRQISPIRFDEINLTGFSDSSSLDISIKNDSIVVFEIMKTPVINYAGYRLGPISRGFVIYDKKLWKSIKGLLEIIINVGMEPELMTVTHFSRNKLEIINKNKLIKEYFYYDIEGEVQNFIDITSIIYNSVAKGKKHHFEFTSRLSNLSSVTEIYSIIVKNLELRKTLPPINYPDVLLETSVYSSIVDGQKIASILSYLFVLKIVPAGTIDSINTKPNQRFRFYFYRTGLSTTFIDTNDPFLFYNKFQWLQMDTSFIRMLK